MACYQTPNVPVINNELASCSTFSSFSLCCNPGEPCLTNGLCSTNTGLFYQGGCTDPLFKASICPQFCTTAGQTYVVQCTGTSGVSEGDFCCSEEGQSTCCENSTNALHLAPSSSFALAGISSVTGSPSSSSETSSTSYSMIASTSPSPSTPSGPTNPPSYATGHWKAITFGVIFGGLLPLFIIKIWLIWSYCRRRRSKRRMRSEANAEPADFASHKVPSGVFELPEAKTPPGELADGPPEYVIAPRSQRESAAEMGTDTEVHGDHASIGATHLEPDRNPLDH